MNDWQIKKINDVTEIVNGGTPDTKNISFWNGNILWITPRDMGKLSSLFVYDTERKITELGLQRSSAKFIPPNSIILSTRAPIGHLAINKHPITTNQGCKGIVPQKDIDVAFLFYFLKNSTELLNDLGGGTTFKELSSSKLKELEIAYPPLGEQKRIVKILDESFEKIDKAKENVEKNLQNSRELFESYLEKIFTYGNVNWIEKKLGEVYDVRDGTHDSPKYQTNGYSLVTSKNLKKNGLNLDSAKYISEQDFIKINQRSKVHKGDILFAMIGTIGNPTITEIEPNFAIKNVALFKIPEDQSNLFLKYYLNSKFVINKMMHEAKGTTQKFVGLGYLRNFVIRLPSLAEQKDIVKKLDELSELTKKLEEIYRQKLERLEELKKSILHKAFAGEL